MTAKIEQFWTPEVARHIRASRKTILLPTLVGSNDSYDATFMKLQKTVVPTLPGEFCEEFIVVCKLRVKCESVALGLPIN